MKDTTHYADLKGLPPLPEVTYPEDITGTNPANLIKDEVFTVSTSRHNDYFFLVPKCAPFFAKGVKVFIKTNTALEKVELIEGIDYTLIMEYKGGTKHTGQPVYGGISLNDLRIEGVLYVTYQTLGGEHIADADTVLTTIIEQMYNPRMILWEYVAGRPNLYPPFRHDENLENFKKLDDLVKVLSETVEAIKIGLSENAQEIRKIGDNIDVQAMNEVINQIRSGTQIALINRVEMLEQEVREIGDLIK